MQIDMKSLGIGFCVGLVLMIVMGVYLTIKRMRERKTLIEANKKLKDRIADKFDIESDNLSNMKEENEKLRKENENLRISLNVMTQNSSNKDIMRAEILQKAIDKLLVSSPGFGTAWGVALQEAEAEAQDIYSGKVPFIKRIFASPSKSTKALPDGSDHE